MYDDIGTPGGANVTIDGASGHMRLAAMNEGITPLFFIEAVQSPSKTAEAGRPICVNEERVRLFVAGDPYNQIVKPVDEAIKERFPEQYKRWKEKHIEMHIAGTPIRQWSLLNPAQVAEFEAIKIFSVEALSQIADNNLMRTTGLREWREKAKAWLETAKDSAAATRYVEANMALQAQVDEQKKQIDELVAKVTALATEKQPHRGRAA